MMDEQSFASFYEKTKRALWRYINGAMGGDPQREDIFQESYIRFLQRGTELDNEMQMKSSLYRIATNLMKDYWRSKKFRRRWTEGEQHNVRAANESDTI